MKKIIFLTLNKFLHLHKNNFVLHELIRLVWDTDRSEVFTKVLKSYIKVLCFDFN